MRKELGLALLAIFFLSMNAITGALAVDNKVQNENEEITILKKKKDVSGDGKPDTIELKGIKYEEGSAYLKEVYLEIVGSNGEVYKQELEGGYDPTLDLVDLNHDRILDLFISIPTGGSGGLSNYYLYTLKDFQLTDIGVPETLKITSQFLDGYKASITIDNTGESYTFDLENRKEDYDRLGLYTNGKLNEPRELMVDPYGYLKPMIVKTDSYGLKGIQQISGAYHADGIAFVESTWYYEKGKWNLIETKIMERNKLNPH